MRMVAIRQRSVSLDCEPVRYLGVAQVLGAKGHTCHQAAVLVDVNYLKLHPPLANQALEISLRSPAVARRTHPTADAMARALGCGDRRQLHALATGSDGVSVNYPDGSRGAVHQGENGEEHKRLPIGSSGYLRSCCSGFASQAATLGPLWVENGRRLGWA